MSKPTRACVAYLAIERLWIDRGEREPEIEDDSVTSMEIRMLSELWNAMTEEERTALRKRRGKTRSEMNRTEILLDHPTRQLLGILGSGRSTPT